MKYFLIGYGLLIVFFFSMLQGQKDVINSSKINPTESEYEKWIAPYRNYSIKSRFSTDESPSKLIITVITEKTSSADEENPFSLNDGKSIYGAVVSTNGQVEFFSQNSFGAKGSCCSQIEKDEFVRIDELIAKLPSDKSVLPPNGRRVVLQIVRNEKFDARVFDLANAPDEIWELLRLTNSNIRSQTLWLKPETEWMASRPEDNEGLAVTSDGRQIITSGLNGPIKIWQTESQKLLREVDLPQNLPFAGIILSPDDSMAIIEGWGVIGVLNTKTWRKIRIIEEPFIALKRFQLSKPHFIKNGKFLLLESSEPSLHIYETKNWTHLNNLPEIPSEAVSYYPASETNRAVYSSKDGQIFLQDIKKRQKIALIDKAKLQFVAFSPDESKVAVITSNHEGDKWTKYRIRLWDAANGKFIKELLLFEQNVCESLEGLMWSPDGRYFLAATKASIFFTSRNISIWNVESGRHRAELSGCPTNITGFGVFSGGSKIIAGCGDSMIRVWSLTEIFAEISKFETSINAK